MLYELHRPALEELREVFSVYLSDCFTSLTCRLVACPDLSTNYGLALSGLGGSPTICDYGSFDYLLPVPNMNKRYNMLEAAKISNIKTGAMIGAGAGPYYITGVNSEMVMNTSFRNEKEVGNLSYYGSYNVTHNLPACAKAESTEFAMLGQFLLCEGKPCEVIEIVAVGRKRAQKFDAMLREALAAKYSTLVDRPVAVGGVVVQESGKCLFHVIPEFCKEPLDNPEKVKGWLKFFEMDPPAVAVGTAVSHDPQKLGLRLEHFHCFNTEGTLAGHCHFDSQDSEAGYKAYLIPGERLLRVDQPA